MERQIVDPAADRYYSVTEYQCVAELVGHSQYIQDAIRPLPRSVQVGSVVYRTN